MEHARAPDPLKIEGSKDKSWRLWKEEFKIFLKASGLDERESSYKANLLMNRIGKEGRETINKIDLEDAEKEDYDVLIEKLDEYYDPPKKEAQERYNFYNTSRKQKESIEDYIDNLKLKAKTCNFGDLTESIIRDRVILDIKDKHLREILFNEKNLDLNKLINIYKSFEINVEKMKEIKQKLDHSKISVNKPETKKVLNPTANNNKPCSKCGTTHAMRNCPAYGHECKNCKEKNHFAHRCPKKNNNINVNHNNKTKAVHKDNPFNQIEK